MSQSFTEKSSKIFISYRRDETADAAGRLSDNLIAHFGKDQIFMDIDYIEPGENFVQAIKDAVSSCQILIAIIGKGWLTSSKDGVTRRLDNPNDFVRLEIATALSRNVRVIPVLIQGATMPATPDLPEDLNQLSHRHAFELSNMRWKRDVESLITSLQRILEKQQEAQQAKARRQREAKDAAEAQRKREDEEKERQRREAEEEAARRLAAERKAARLAEEERARAAAEAVLVRKAAEEIDQRRREAQERQQRAEEEKQRQAEEDEARRKQAEEKEPDEETIEQRSKGQPAGAADKEIPTLPVYGRQVSYSKPTEITPPSTPESPAREPRSYRMLYIALGTVMLIASLIILYAYTSSRSQEAAAPQSNAPEKQTSNAPVQVSTPPANIGANNANAPQISNDSATGSQTEEGITNPIKSPPMKGRTEAERRRRASNVLDYENQYSPRKTGKKRSDKP
ncbi:MAG TPA: TIR domain-containing protein [Pyrinomonadaceae bacterium]|jgi:hypothetical protein